MTITTPGQNARFTFDAVAGQQVSLRLHNVTIGAACCGGTNVLITDPGGGFVRSGQVGTNGLTIGPIVILDTGVHSITLDPDGTNTGRLDLTLYRNATEVDQPGCRWPHTAFNFTTLTYQWGDRLQTSGTLWRTAFEAAMLDWNGAPTLVRFQEDINGQITINTYDAQDNLAGYAEGVCTGATTTAYRVWGNAFTDIRLGYTANQRRAVASHELGHSNSVGHIADPEPALLGSNPDSNVLFTPQPLDTGLVNQIYP